MYMSADRSILYGSASTFYRLALTPKGRLISGGSDEWQFYPVDYLSLARNAPIAPSPSLPKTTAPFWTT